MYLFTGMLNFRTVDWADPIFSFIPSVKGII